MCVHAHTQIEQTHIPQSVMCGKKWSPFGQSLPSCTNHCSSKSPKSKQLLLEEQLTYKPLERLSIYCSSNAMTTRLWGACEVIPVRKEAHRKFGFKLSQRYHSCSREQKVHATDDWQISKHIKKKEAICRDAGPRPMPTVKLSNLRLWSIFMPLPCHEVSKHFGYKDTV